MTDHEPAAGAWDLTSLLSTQPAPSADPPAAEPPPRPATPPRPEQAPAADTPIVDTPPDDTTPDDTTAPITPAEPASPPSPAADADADADAESTPVWIRDAATTPAPDAPPSRSVDQPDQPVYPTVPNRRVVLVGGAVAAVLLAAVGGVTAVTMANQGDRQTQPPAAAPSPPDAGFTEFPATTTTGDAPLPESTPAEPGPEPSTDPEAEALAQLEQLRQQDALTTVFDGRFVAQLASKSVGIVDPLQTTAAGSHTFTAADILAEHLALRSAPSRGTSVVLVLSTDFGKRQLYQGNPLWVTFALGDFPTRESVQRWCAKRFPGLTGDRLTNQCTARKLEAHQ